MVIGVSPFDLNKRMQSWSITGITIEEAGMHTRRPTHPGEVLLEDVMKPLGITITEAARDLGVSRKTLSETVNGRCALSPEMAVRVGKATNTSPESWLAMQSKLDLWKVMQKEPRDVTKFEQSLAGNQ
jgi:addiction module HigA family antidote